MDVVHQVLVVVCGVVGAVGAALVVAPARQARLRGWLQRAGVEHDDASVVAVQAALSRGAIAGAAVMVVLFSAFLALGLKAVGLALALAALLTTFLPVGGGVRRHAGLTGAAPAPAVGAGRLLALVGTGLVVAAGLVGVQRAAFHPREAVSGLAVDTSTVLPELAVYTLPVLAAVAVTVPLIVGAAHLLITGRAGLSGAAGGVDAALRAHQLHLATRAGAAAELVLAAVLVRFAPLVATGAAPEVYDNAAVHGAGLLALLVVAAALAVLVRGAILPTPRRVPALEPASTR